jgi:riboflavin synthase
MFTGIIETLGTVTNIVTEGSNKHFEIQSVLSNELKIDQSVAHNGVCLTVVKQDNETHLVTAIEESLIKTNLNDLRIGDKVNLERCLPYQGRLDGHVVQGHVDQVGTIRLENEADGSWNYRISHEAHPMFYTIDKGSITINGVSLTCFNCSDTGFNVSIIPYTHEHTNFHTFNKDQKVNLEFDILGKYVQTHLHKLGLDRLSSESVKIK